MKSRDEMADEEQMRRLRVRHLATGEAYRAYVARLPLMGIVPIEGTDGRGFTRVDPLTR